MTRYMAILNGAEGVGRPLPSTSAVLGGLLAQEIIKVVSRRDVPLYNSVLLNSLTFQASVYELPKIKPKVEVRPQNQHAAALFLCIFDGNVVTRSRRV